jgi:hypothetical protein
MMHTTVVDCLLDTSSKHSYPIKVNIMNTNYLRPLSCGDAPVTTRIVLNAIAYTRANGRAPRGVAKWVFHLQDLTSGTCLEIFRVLHAMPFHIARQAAVSRVQEVHGACASVCIVVCD